MGILKACVLFLRAMLTCRLITTRRCHVKWNQRRWAKSYRSGKRAVCIIDTRVLRDRKHRLAWMALHYRSACDGEIARFARCSRLLRGHFPGCHSIRRVSGWLVQFRMEFLGRTGPLPPIVAVPQCLRLCFSISQFANDMPFTLMIEETSLEFFRPKM